MNQNTGLTLEQEFKLQVIMKDVSAMSKEQAQDFLIEAIKQIMFKDVYITQILKNRL